MSKTHHIKDRNGKTHTVEEWGYEVDQRKGTMRVEVCIDNSAVKMLKMYYRPERTWNDHMGNTPCGYYAIIPINKRERRRVYLTLNC